MAKVPENAQELFNVQVPEALSKFPDKAREIGAIYLFKIPATAAARGPST